MHRILVVAKRDYLAVVRTKAFILGLIVFPIMFGGGSMATALLQNRDGAKSRRVAILDHTGVAAPEIIRAAKEKKPDSLAGDAGDFEPPPPPSLDFEIVAPDPAHPDEQRLALSDRLRSGELAAFLEVGSDALHPQTAKPASIAYYAAGGGIDTNARTLAEAVNNGLRRARLKELGVAETRFPDVLASVSLQNMALITRDSRTGAIHEPRKRGAAESFAIPFVLVLMLAMIVMIGASPTLSNVAEDKLQRVFEMLLGTVTPFELIAGKVLASVAQSLTSSIFYIIGGLLLLQGMALFGVAPLALLPWFFVYLLAEVVMLCALAAALGAACGSPQDAQQLVIFLFIPIIFPLFLLAPVMQAPNGPFATAMSLFPLFTPLVMMLRQSLPGGVPAWQPWVGLVEILILTPVMTWGAARIFRVAILAQGQRPSPAELLRWAVRG